MRLSKKANVGLGCLSLLIGAAPALYIPLYLINRKLFADWLWAIAAPAWAFLDPGAHDGPIILLAVLLDTFIFAAIIYAIIYALLKLFRGRTPGADLS